MSKLIHRISILRTKKRGLSSMAHYILPGFLLFLFSCNPNFTDEEKEPVYTTDTYFHFETGERGGVIEFRMDPSQKGNFQVVVYPQWLDVKTFEGQLNDGFCTVPFEFKNIDNFLYEGRAEGQVFVKFGYAGIFGITVSYGANKIDQPPVDGQVPLSCSATEIDFGLENTDRFAFTNSGQVNKTWYIEHIPSWLQLSETGGVINAGESKIITCTVNREGLAPGDYSQIIDLESNNPQLSHGILMRMKVENSAGPVNSNNLKWFDGELKDAYYCKTTDKLYMLTKSPNKLLVKTATSDSLEAYALERVPNCLDVTADGKTIAIGYNQAYVDIINAETMERKELYETDCVPYDLVFGENGWCYLSPDTDQWVHLYGLNLESGVTFRSTSSVAIYEKSVFVKMPEKPLIYITRPQLSPTGLLIANIEDGMANDTLPYWHESIGHRFWFSKDGSKILGANKEIYQNPGYTTSSTHGHDLSRFGKIDIPRNTIQSLDYNKKLQSYYVVGSDYSWGIQEAETIYRVNEVSFEADKSFKVASYPGRLNNTNNPPMDVHYVFTNTEGKQLYAIKNVQQSLNLNIWALETFSLPLN